MSTTNEELRALRQLHGIVECINELVLECNGWMAMRERYSEGLCIGMCNLANLLMPNSVVTNARERINEALIDAGMSFGDYLYAQDDASSREKFCTKTIESINTAIKDFSDRHDALLAQWPQLANNVNRYTQLVKSA